MKRKLLMLTLLISLFTLGSISTQAQGKGPRHKNQKQVGPPPWAPAHGYRAKTRYVYFRDYGVYYDNTRGVYISLHDGKWEVTARIPVTLLEVDLKAAVKIDLDLDTDTPQKFYNEHKKKYPPKRERKG